MEFPLSPSTPAATGWQVQFKSDFSAADGLADSARWPGFFLSFEGGDWTGKSTQTTLLHSLLTTQLGANSVARTFEPGANALGVELRKAIMHGLELDPRTEALLYAADRAYHAYSQLIPWLEAGKVVVCDRYLDSSVAYQGQGRGLGTQTIRNLSLWATGGLLPHLTLVFDGDPQLLVSRRPQTGLDRIEQSGMQFHQQVRASFLQLVAEEKQAREHGTTQLPARFQVINAEESICEVHRQVVQAVVAQAKALIECGSESTQNATQIPLLQKLTCLTALTESEITTALAKRAES